MRDRFNSRTNERIQIFHRVLIRASVLIGVGMRDLTSPLPPNRTGGSPASGSPVSGFVVVRLYVSMHVPPPRTAAHAGQTIRSASGDGPSPALSRHHPTAIAADCATVVSHSHPHFGTCSVCCAGNTHTSPAKSGSLPSRFPSGYARPAATSSSTRSLNFSRLFL